VRALFHSLFSFRPKRARKTRWTSTQSLLKALILHPSPARKSSRGHCNARGSRVLADGEKSGQSHSRKRTISSPSLMDFVRELDFLKGEGVLPPMASFIVRESTLERLTSSVSVWQERLSTWDRREVAADFRQRLHFRRPRLRALLHRRRCFLAFGREKRAEGARRPQGECLPARCLNYRWAVGPGRMRSRQLTGALKLKGRNSKPLSRPWLDESRDEPEPQ